MPSPKPAAPAAAPEVPPVVVGPVVVSTAQSSDLASVWAQSLREAVKLLADLRTWAAVFLFALTWHIFDMLDDKPALTSNQGFMFLAQALIVTGLVGLVLGFLFAASKSAADARAQQAGAPTATQKDPASSAGA